MIDQSEQDAMDFQINAWASLAKAVAFRSIAIRALEGIERITASISAYYSLFHVAITLLYLCPDKIDDTKLLEKLRERRSGGLVDPSRAISHASALTFVERCTLTGLDPKFPVQLESGKDLREHVNYGPRITIKNGEVSFGPCEKAPADCDRLVAAIDASFLSALDWVSNRTLLKGTSRLAVEKCRSFFVQTDLFYCQWCAKESIQVSIEFVAQLERRYLIPS